MGSSLRWSSVYFATGFTGHLTQVFTALRFGSPSSISTYRISVSGVSISMRAFTSPINCVSIRPVNRPLNSGTNRPDFVDEPEKVIPISK
jgi:hypothetical protein